MPDNRNNYNFFLNNDKNNYAIEAENIRHLKYTVIPIITGVQEGLSSLTCISVFGQFDSVVALSAYRDEAK